MVPPAGHGAVSTKVCPDEPSVTVVVVACGATRKIDWSTAKPTAPRTEAASTASGVDEGAAGLPPQPALSAATKTPRLVGATRIALPALQPAAGSRQPAAALRP